MYSKYRARVYRVDESCGECDVRENDLCIVTNLHLDGQGKVTSIDTIDIDGEIKSSVPMDECDLFQFTGNYDEVTKAEKYERVWV